MHCHSEGGLVNVRGTCWGGKRLVLELLGDIARLKVIYLFVAGVAYVGRCSSGDTVRRLWRCFTCFAFVSYRLGNTNDRELLGHGRRYGVSVCVRVRLMHVALLWWTAQ